MGYTVIRESRALLRLEEYEKKKRIEDKIKKRNEMKEEMGQREKLEKKRLAAIKREKKRLQIEREEEEIRIYMESRLRKREGDRTIFFLLFTICLLRTNLFQKNTVPNLRLNQNQIN